MTLDDFRQLPAGTTLRLYYHWINKGNFEWRHSHVEKDRVFGAFRYAGDEWSEVSDYLYEFNGQVCRGSGAEPVFRTKQQAEASRLK